jgi:hypothetical protein
MKQFWAKNWFPLSCQPFRELESACEVKYFQPRPSPLIQELINDRIKSLGASEVRFWKKIKIDYSDDDVDIVESDNDVWVEQAYRRKKGGNMRYYVSMTTRSMYLIQPPTGAAVVLRQHEIANYLAVQDFVKSLPPISKELVRTMIKPKKNNVKFLKRAGFNIKD